MSQVLNKHITVEFKYFKMPFKNFKVLLNELGPCFAGLERMPFAVPEAVTLCVFSTDTYFSQNFSRFFFNAWAHLGSLFPEKLDSAVAAQ